jgi:hypothetical protein
MSLFNNIYEWLMGEPVKPIKKKKKTKKKLKGK